MNELRAERNVEVDQLGLAWLVSQTGHSNKAVEIPDETTRGLVVDRMTASEQSRHHRLGDTRCERRSDCGIRRVATILQHHYPCGHRRRMAASYGRLHRTRSY